MADITFLNIHFLWLLFTIPIMIALHFFLMKHTRQRAVLFANFEALKRVTGSMVLSKNITLLVIRNMIILFLTLSAAGMTVWTEGPGSEFNYVIAVDASSSMLADDFTPNRLVVAKDTAKSFINSLNAEVKIGVVSFSGISKVETALNNDRGKVEEAVDGIDISSAGGTDITGAITTAVNVLLTDYDRSMSVILLTDGQHTVGGPLEEGIKYAAQNRVMVHTIGIATEKGGSFELTQLLSTINEETLQRISDNTGGKFYKVGDEAEMAAAFQEIVTLSEQNIPHSLRMIFLVIGLLLLLAEWTLISTRFKTLP
ncbi:VWA domain-containing protein [Candidatus Woesearchaeota archaeon]|nr:VWA domain-containing protein [Candidatus Woesearchaeota archaeon]